VATAKSSSPSQAPPTPHKIVIPDLARSMAVPGNIHAAADMWLFHHAGRLIDAADSLWSRALDGMPLSGTVLERLKEYADGMPFPVSRETRIDTGERVVDMVRGPMLEFGVDLLELQRSAWSIDHGSNGKKMRQTMLAESRSTAHDLRREASCAGAGVTAYVLEKIADQFTVAARVLQAPEMKSVLFGACDTGIAGIVDATVAPEDRDDDRTFDDLLDIAFAGRTALNAVAEVDLDVVLLSDDDLATLALSFETLRVALGEESPSAGGEISDEEAQQEATVIRVRRQVLGP
jgi:hypothetical protein